MNPNINIINRKWSFMYAIAAFIGGSGVVRACDPGGFRQA